MTRFDGQQVGAVFGFVSMTLSSLSNKKLLGIVFDTKAQTFRHKLYAAYKANRPPPAELPFNSSLPKKLVVLGWPIIERAGFEADDLMASYAHHLHGSKTATVLVSDKDLMQVVSDHTRMLDLLKDHLDEKLF